MTLTPKPTKRRRLLPFSPWHLALAPAALVFAIPLLWLLLSSFTTNAQINQFPPTIIPRSLHWVGYHYAFKNALFPRWFINSTMRIVLPLARPALSTVAVLTFLTTWNELAWPLIAINSDHNYTLQLGLATFQGQHRTQWSAVMAGNVITVLPVLVAFLFTQRTFIQSLTSSAIKG